MLWNVNHAVLQSGQDDVLHRARTERSPDRRGATRCRWPRGDIRWRSSGAPAGGTETIGEPGTLLGAFADAQSVSTSVELAPGDTLLLYTDGITDVAPPYDLATDALCELFETSCASADSAAEVADRLGGEVSAILPLADRNDDIALLVVRIADAE